MLSTGKFRDLYQSKEYTHCNYWLATIHGMTASQTWYWARKEDGSSRGNSESNAYAASNNHQPRVVNEVHSTMIDLNSVAEYILAFQRQRRPFRIYHSKISAIKCPHYMDDTYFLYRDMDFHGITLGFATEKILKANECDCDVLAIYRTPYVSASEVDAVQDYLNCGGTVIMDSASFLADEYGRSLNNKLTHGKGKLIITDELDDICHRSIGILESCGSLPDFRIRENDDDKNTCEWKVIKASDNSYFLNVVNLGKKAVSISILPAPFKRVAEVTDVLTGTVFDSMFEMPLYGVRFLEVKFN